jgi:hypothetical protein
MEPEPSLLVPDFSNNFVGVADAVLAVPIMPVLTLMLFEWKGCTTNDSIVIMNEEKFSRNKDTATQWNLTRRDIAVGGEIDDATMLDVVNTNILVLVEEGRLRLYNENAVV